MDSCLSNQHDEFYKIRVKYGHICLIFFSWPLHHLYPSQSKCFLTYEFSLSKIVDAAKKEQKKLTLSLSPLLWPLLDLSEGNYGKLVLVRAINGFPRVRSVLLHCIITTANTRISQ